MKNLIILLSFLLVNSSLNAQQVHIYGTVQDTSTFKVSVDGAVIFSTDFISKNIASAEITRDKKSFSLLFDISYPQRISFYNNYNQYKIFVSPGDTIRCEVNNEDTRFYGKNASSYNFITDLERQFPPKNEPKLESINDSTDYLNKAQKWESDRLLFLRNYTDKQSMREESKRFFTQQIKYDFICSKLNVNPALKFELNQSQLIDAACYSYMSSLIRRYIKNPLKDNISLDSIYQQGKLNLYGKDRDYFLANLLGLYGENYKLEKDNILKLIEYCNDVQDSVYKNYIAAKRDLYLVQANTFPDSLLNTVKLIDTAGKRFTLGEILKKYSSKSLYIDFWASWCIPCRYDIVNSVISKKWLQTHDVAYIYISKDTDLKQWKKAIQNDKTFENQYLLIDKTKKMEHYINLNLIPRYLYLDRLHQIKSLYAPKPIPVQFENLKKLINGNSQSVETFKY